jgi:hypothetical protein
VEREPSAAWGGRTVGRQPELVGSQGEDGLSDTPALQS